MAMGKVKSWRLERCEDGQRKCKAEEEDEDEEVSINKVETTTTTKVNKKKRKREEEVGIKKKKKKKTDEEEVGINKKKKPEKEEEVVGIKKKKKKKNKLEEEEVGIKKKKKKKKKKSKPEEEEVGIKKKKKSKPEEVKNGDKFNLSELLFTKERDFLIKYNDNQPVKADQLANKFIVLYFASLVYNDSTLWTYEVYLSDIYRELHPKGLLEVVFVAVGDDIPFSRKLTHSERFQQKISHMPWPAIPFSDPVSRKHLGLRFGFPVREISPSAFVFDPTGVVLQRDGFSRFCFGSAAFPFDDKTLNRLVSEYDAILEKPSLEKLLVSPQRDYLINNENVQVPVRDLRNKVIALYLYEDGRNDDLTAKLKEAYEKLVLKKKKNFEVVLVYISTSWQTCRTTTEETFWKAFKTMPWLALPFKDPNVIKLQHIFNYPFDLDKECPDPSLVIIGRRGKYFEPYGADILMKFGCPAFPFVSDRAAELVAEKANKVRLEMFWGPNTVFKCKRGSTEEVLQVQISQLVGKKIIVLFDDDWLDYYPSPMRRLKKMYSQMKGTDDEFEVIQVFQSKRRYSHHDHITALPWLTYPCFKKNSVAEKVLYSVFPHGDGLLAFDHEGTVVRRASFPIIEKDIGFPFYNGDVRKEALMDLRSGYSWSYHSDDDM